MDDLIIRKYIGAAFIVAGLTLFFIRPIWWILSIPLFIVGMVIQTKRLRKNHIYVKTDDNDRTEKMNESHKVEKTETAVDRLSKSEIPKITDRMERSKLDKALDLIITRPLNAKEGEAAKIRQSINHHPNFENTKEGRIPLHSIRLDGTPIYWQEDGVHCYAPTKKRVYKTIRRGKRGRIGHSKIVKSWSRVGIGKLQITPDGFTFVSDMGMEHFKFAEIVDVDMSTYPTGIRMYMKNGKAVVLDFKQAKEMFYAIRFYKQEAPAWQLIKEPTGAMIVKQINKH